MALCNKCKVYNTQYDEFRQNWDDILLEPPAQNTPHYCIMYEDNIPNKIYYDGAVCKFYEPKDAE